MISNPYTPPADVPRKDRGTAPEDDDPPKPFPGCSVVFFLLFGAVGMLLGLAWIRTFGFTDYRAHLSYVGLPLGIVTLLFSLVFLWLGVTIIRRNAVRRRP